MTTSSLVIRGDDGGRLADTVAVGVTADADADVTGVGEAADGDTGVGDDGGAEVLRAG